MYFLYSLGGVTFNKCWITLSILNCYSPNFQGFTLMKNALNNQVGMLGNVFLWLVANLKQGVIYFIKQESGNHKIAWVYLAYLIKKSTEGGGSMTIFYYCSINHQYVQNYIIYFLIHFTFPNNVCLIKKIIVNTVVIHFCIYYKFLWDRRYWI